MIEKYVDAEELKRLLSTLMVVLGCIMIGGFFASIVVPGLRNANRPQTPTAVAPVVGESGWLDPTEFPAQKGGEVAPVDPQTLMKPSGELIARGKTLFENNCVACHGNQGHGDGPAAATMNPRPRNFASRDGWKNGSNAPGMFQTLKAGIPGTSMPSFDYLSKKDRMALIHYVQSLGTFSHDTADAGSIDALSRELASAGEKIPNKIPVSQAMIKLADEAPAVPPIVIEQDSQEAGAELLRKVVTDPARVSQFLNQSRLWRTGYRDLAAAVVRETPVNGFSVGAAALTKDEWQLLHGELLKRVKSK